MRHIYIVEDRLQDLSSFLINLHAVLHSSKELEKAEDIKIHFIEIQWREDSSSNNEYKNQEDYVTRWLKDASYVKFLLDHKVVRLDEADYKSSCEEIAMKVYENLKDDFVSPYDEVIESTTPPKHINSEEYVVLLDLILNIHSQTDETNCFNKEKILSHFLYKIFGDERTILYSDYPRAAICNAWLVTAGIINEEEQRDKIISRQYITSSYAIYLPYEKKIFSILKLNKGEEF